LTIIEYCVSSKKGKRSSEMLEKLKKAFDNSDWLLQEQYEAGKVYLVNNCEIASFIPQDLNIK
jgi:hypothetical protein